MIDRLCERCSRVFRQDESDDPEDYCPECEAGDTVLAPPEVMYEPSCDLCSESVPADSDAQVTAETVLCPKHSEAAKKSE